MNKSKFLFLDRLSNFNFTDRLWKSKNKERDGAVWRYTHCTYVQYVLVRHKYACYSEPLIIIRDGPS